MSLRVGLCGGGTVGGGVVEMLRELESRLQSQSLKIEVATICVRDLNKPRDFQAPDGVKWTTSYQEILDDDSINCVVELMGGVTDAKEVVFGAIKRKKHVVTANKPLLAKYLSEIQALLAETPGVQFGFEASVCGGIPIIHTLQRDLSVTTHKQVMGIMNGTTNFILSKMESEGVGYQETLAEAQKLGYAEADPTADVGGFDARSKLCILTKLAFGVHVSEDDIYCVGIEDVSNDDFAYAKSLKATIKLLGVAKQDSDGKLSVFVSPVMVPDSGLMASARGAANAIQIDSVATATTFLVGQGAGRFPTANSVVSDLVMVAGNACPTPFTLNADVPLKPDFEGRFYCRIRVGDELGIIARVGEVCAKHTVSIHSILQNPIVDRSNICFVIVTEISRLSHVTAAIKAIEEEKFCIGKSLVIPLSD